MDGPLEYRFGTFGFHLVTAEHHHRAVGDLGDDTHVVGNEKHGHAAIGLQFPNEVEDLRLDGDVERCRRFVSNEQFRAAGERHRDHNALPHTAGKVVRIFRQPPFGGWNADMVEQPACLGERLGIGEIAMPF
ncbi:hypothetical protein D3C73_1054850 [compost metagenome]